MAPAPDAAGQRGDGVGGEAHRLADLAQRAARAVADDGGGQRRALAAVLAIDVLHHLLAALVLEVDVDVRRLLALGGDEDRKSVVEGKSGSVSVDTGGRRPHKT